jgi:DNA topoisomerase-3
MNLRHGMSAARTLEVAQELYEKKLLTYPRTDSRHLSLDMVDPVRTTLGQLRSWNPEALAVLAAYISGAPEGERGPRARSKRVFDDSKVSDHHAIIPTGKLETLGGEAQQVFDAVATALRAGVPRRPRAGRDDRTRQLGGGAVPRARRRRHRPRLECARTRAADQTQVAQESESRRSCGREPGRRGRRRRDAGAARVHRRREWPAPTRTARRQDQTTAALHREHAARGDGDFGQNDRRRTTARSDARPRARHAGDARVDPRDLDLARLHPPRQEGAARHRPRPLPDRDHRRPDAEVRGAHRRVGMEARRGRTRPARARCVPRRDPGPHSALISTGLSPRLDLTTLGTCPRCHAAVLEGREAYGCSRWRENCAFRLPKVYRGHRLSPEQVRELLQRGVSLRPIPLEGAPRIVCRTATGELLDLVPPSRDAQRPGTGKGGPRKRHAAG